MGLSSEEIARLGLRYVWHPFTQMREWLESEPLVIAAAEGNYLIDARGNRYLDGVASLWCNVHGHRKEAIDRAIREQLSRVAHSTLLGLAGVPSARLAARLAEISPSGLTKVFYSDSGATAVEVALKLALQYWQIRGRSEKRAFVALEGGYHGDTLGAISVGWSETFHRFFPPLLPVHRLRPPFLIARDLGGGGREGEALGTALEQAEAILREHSGEIAAIVLEPLIQGAAGMWPQPIQYLPGLAALAKRYGVLLICDEVATGFGRTGKMFACDHTATSPDILCLGKGLTGGYLPLAATLTTQDIFDAFLGRYEEYVTFFHGHTFTGNALGCAAALASLEVFDRERVLEQLPAKVELASRLLDRLVKPLPVVAEARQVGLMIGIELARERAPRPVPFDAAMRVGHRVCMEARTRGVVIRPLGDVIVLMPPLAISAEELEALVDATAWAISRVSSSL